MGGLEFLADLKKGTIRKHAFYKYPGNTGTNRAEAEIEFHRKFTVGPSARPRTMPLKSGGGKQPPGAPSVPSSFSARRSTNKELVSATHGMPRPCLLLLPRPPPHLRMASTPPHRHLVCAHACRTWTTWKSAPRQSQATLEIPQEKPEFPHQETEIPHSGSRARRPACPA
jgi:hypothetical protein